MTTDKKGTDRLIKLIQSGQTTPGYEKPEMEAKFAALGALHYAVVDQDVPNVMSFFKPLTDVDNATKLAVSTAYSPTASKSLQRTFLL